MLSRSAAAASEGSRTEVVMSSCVEVGTASAPRRRRPGAFTLMEMVVVASIIVVIIAILLPAIGKARESGRRARCVSNMTQIGHGLTSYCMDNNGAFPGTAPAGSPRKEDWLYWQTLPTAPTPTDTFYFAKSPILKTLGTQDESILRCPSDDVDSHAKTQFGVYSYSYVMNYMMSSLPSQTVPGANAKTAARLTGVKSPASKVLLYEEDELTINDGTGEVDVQDANGYADLLSLRHEGGKRGTNVDYRKYLDPSRKGNVLFCDGHIDLMSQKDLHDPNGLYTNPTK
jgi:prepilin-type processing-associated H-X9-DG protein